MKFCYLLFFICLLSVDAQRRSVKSELLSENEPQPKTARRGRARFTLTSESPQVDEPKRSETSSRRLSSRRRPSETHVATPVKIAKSYEVEEIVDEAPLEALRRPKSKLFAETPIESFRKPSNSKLYTEAKFEETPVESVRRPSSKLYNEPKFEETPVESVRRPSAKLYTEAKFHETSERRPVKSRVLTETKFEAQNAPSSNALFQPSTTENLDEIIKSIGDVLDTTSSSVPLSSTLSSSSLESLSSELTSEVTKIDNDISRTQPETTTPITSRTTRRSNGRSRSNVAASPTVASRVRSRTRATRRPEEPSPAPTAGRTVHRGARRRNEPPSVESRTRGPPVIQAAETMEAPTRSRNGRRTPGTAARKNEEVTVPEKVTLDLPQSRRLGSRKSVETTTFRSRSRTRSRDIPPIIDEQKLEVLPLFERESKTVRPLRSGNSRRRNINSAEEVETSATENDIKVGPKPPKETVVVETRTESTIKRRKIISKVSRRSTTTSKPTVQTSKTTVQTPKSTIVTRKPVVKESVISEVSEVTSKRTVSRQNKAARTKTESPKFVQRGTKKSEINLTNVKSKSSVTSSEEEIDDSDNYPEQFKALLQAKKQKKESRSQHRLVTAAPAVTKTTEKVVNSSPSSTTQVIASEASRQQLEESENELVPRKVQPGRRFTQTTEKATRPTRKSKVARSTTVAPSTSTKEHRFHAKFNTEPEATTSSPVKSGRSLSPKPPRGLYSSRKTKESYTKNKSPSGQIPTPKKSNRYSSRYRNDAAARGAIRTSTNAPAYLPTIPTITPPTTSVKSSYRDKDLGVEVISFDDPVNTVPSANLVSGEYLASSTESHLTSPLVNWQNNKIKTETEKTLFLKVAASQTKTTEKPFSIIESIINSITAISTTEKPDPTKLTFSTDDPTQASAILKLATKKPTKLDKTQTTQLIPVVTVTSEKPTTIIERILSSLSAIQADNNTDTKNFKSKQVEQNTIPPVEANPLSISTVNIPPTTGTTPSSTVPTAQANPLSVSSSSSTSTTESSTSTSTSTSSPPPVSTTSATTTSSTTSAATLPTLTEILTGRTGKAFNSIINISDLTKVETLKVDPKTNRVLNADEFKNKTGVIYRWKPVTSSTYMFQTDLTSTTLPSPTLSNRILDNPTTMPPMTSMRFTTMPPMTSMRFTTMPPMTLPASIRLTTTPTTTMAPTTTPFFTTTTMPPTTTPMQTRRQTTIPPFTQPVTSSFQTTTGFPTSTYFPQFLTTLFSTIRPRRVSATESPITIVTPISNRIQPVTSPRVDISTNVFDLTTAGSTRRPTTVDLTTGTTRRIATTTVPTTVPFTVPISTTVRSRRRSTTTTTTLPTTTTILTTTTPPTTRATSQRSARRSTTTEATTTTTNATKKLRQLTEQQKKDLEAIAQLEQEQAAILRQLAFLTNLNIGGNMRTTTDRTDLAKRIVALAVERDKDRPKPITTTPLPEVSTPESKREAKKISVSSDQSLEEIVKQFNIVTPSPITTEYGKSNDAIIAALLKEQGIGPTTPKVLEDVYSHTTTTTKRPKTTTRPPGPLMQSLNWLLNVLAPQPTTTTTTKRPKPKTKTKSKPKPKPKPEPKPDEILTHQPTHITPVVTAAPRRNLVSSLSQQDIQKLIRQLENIQKDPTNSQELDFSQIKSLQALLNSDEGVQVTSSGSTGATSRPNTTPLTTAKRRNKGRVAKSTTAEPLSVSNSIADDEEFVSTTTTRSRVSLPPVRLRPVPGIEDGDTLVRGQLITAAVNVTRAISSFLGTALQDAAQQVSRLFANGSANFKDYLGSSSVLANASNFSAASRV
ncbi:mucin-2 isoform X8 [Tribolium castaneum]|uniref:mucin-2 isoform X8 n=1 Tax=Tribolium castaneum TaxID=7070 RepID=UPI0030FE2727